MSSPPPSWQPPAGSRPQGARQLCVYAPAKAPTPRPKRPASVSASVGARHRGTRVTEAVVAPRLAWRSFLAVHHRGGMSQPWRSVGRCPRPRPHRTTLAHLEPLTGLSLGGFLPVQVPPSAPVTSGDAPRRGRCPHRVHNCCSPVGAGGTTPGSFGGMPDGVEVAPRPLWPVRLGGHPPLPPDQAVHPRVRHLAVHDAVSPATSPHARTRASRGRAPMPRCACRSRRGLDSGPAYRMPTGARRARPPSRSRCPRPHHRGSSPGMHCGSPAVPSGETKTGMPGGIHPAYRLLRFSRSNTTCWTPCC